MRNRPKTCQIHLWGNWSYGVARNAKVGRERECLQCPATQWEELGNRDHYGDCDHRRD